MRAPSSDQPRLPNTPRRQRRWAMGAFVLLAALPIAGWIWLTSDSGGRFLRSQALITAAREIEGRLELDRVTFSPPLGLKIEGIRLFAPDATSPAFEARRILVSVRPIDLIHRRIHLSTLTIEQPAIHLLREDDTNNLARAIRVRSPAPTASDRPFSFDAPDLRIENGSFAQDGARAVAAEHIDLSMALQGDAESIELSTKMTLQVVSPFARELRIALDARKRGDSISVPTLRFDLGHSHAVLRAELTGPSHGRIELVESTLAAEDARALDPRAPLLTNLSLDGDATLDTRRITARLDARAEGGLLGLTWNARLENPADPATLIDHAFTLRATNVALAKWLDEMPNATLDLQLSGTGKGPLDDHELELQLRARGSRYEKLALDEAELSARVRRGAAHIRSMKLSAAALSLTAEGEVDAKGARMDVRLTAADLARTRRALEKGLGRSLPDLAGSMNLSLSTAGSYASPTGSIDLDAPTLTLDEYVLTGARASIALEQLQPLTGSVTGGRIESIRGGGIEGRGLRVAGKVDGRSMRFDIDGELARTPGSAEEKTRPLPLRLHVDAAHLGRKAGADRWRLSHWSATALGLDIASRAPTVIVTEHDRTTLDALDLSLLGGRVLFSGTFGPRGAYELHARLEDLRLEKLPAAMRPKNVTVSGAIRGTLDAADTHGDPTLALDLTLERGRYGAVQPVSLELRASVEHRLATMNGSLLVPGEGRVLVDATLPARSPAELVQSRDPSPIDGRLRVEHVDLALARPWMTEDPNLAGRLDGEVRLSGSWPKPVIDGSLDGHALSIRGMDGLETLVTLAVRDEQATARLDLQRAPSLRMTSELSAPLTPDPLLNGTKPDLTAWPFESHLWIEQLDLGWLASIGRAPRDLSGQLAMKVSASGPARALRSNGTVTLTNVMKGSLGKLDAAINLDAADRVTLRARSQLDREPLAEGELSIAQSAGALLFLEEGRWLELPVTADVRLLPTPWQRLVPESPASPHHAVDARVSGRWVFSGSALDPRTELHASAEEIRTGKTKLGRCSFDMEGSSDGVSFAGDYRSSTSSGEATLQGHLPGPFDARSLAREGSAALRQNGPVNPPSLLDSIESGLAKISDRPLDLSLHARAFDLSLADGLASGMHGLSGTLDADLVNSGPIDLSGLSGKVRVTGGHASMQGVGVFDETTLDLSFSRLSIDLNELSGRLGSGRFTMQASADRNPDGSLLGSWRGAMTSVPLIQNNQTRGLLTLKGEASGWKWEDRRLIVPELVLSEGLLKVPEMTSRAVQAMEPHPEILVDGRREKAEPTTPPDWRADVGIVIPDDFRIEAPLGNHVVLGARLQAKFDPALEGDGRDALDVTGKVRFPRGTIRLLQARFEIEPGSEVTLFPGNWRDPTLDITAKHDSKGVTVTAAFTGTASHVVRNLTSKPEMDEAEILYFVATGQRQNKAQSDPFALNRETLDDTLIGLAGSFGSTFARSFLQQYLGRAADLDVLAIDPRGSARVGTFLWNGRLYLGAQVKPNANVLAGENTAELDAEYRINEKAYGRLRVGDQNRSGLELMYQDSVPSAAQKKGKARK